MSLNYENKIWIKSNHLTNYPVFYELKGALIPKERWVLMGLDISDYEKLRGVNISDNALYKITGNGLVANVAEAIGKEVLKLLK